MATVTLAGVRKSYGEREVVHGVDCAVADRELVVVVGPSGCGKSTLLRMVAGLETITAGSVAIDGRVVNGVEPKDRDIAMVFQNYALYPHMSVYDNMAYGLKMRHMPRAEIRIRVERAAATLQLDGLLERKPRQLSGGQRQRVAMGRAIVRDPKVFLFDEPLSNLDAQLRVQMRVEIKRLQQELGTTSLYVTHDQVEAMTLADRLIVMNAGNVDQIGPPLDLYDRPATEFVARFIGSPAMNLLAGRIADGTVAVGDAALAHDRTAGGPGEVTVGLRPEHLEITDTGPLPLKVELLERLGADTIVHGRLPDGRAMVARGAGVMSLALGETIRLAIRPDHIHLFNPDSGHRI
ncbi:MAG TPA: sn-glycerol-3-phosphate ABC transporter ATP-binding protein UgpC [Stellaceae bacterium]|jgi:sn-glycerol 3-phosphate transport system ATP-binding protein|nr:sn-glycerol-3-phosphate ABC transporter ATP-binding protein UgpC [Stellaceae bacterium]